ncbi:cation:proton antiporter [Pseudoalteromonas denitrificans]|uniref:Sodium/proton antiporter, CPA1 family n=1 Tax=Pseudoalteromonas denitrificans DSM 6059 TaxID=1123010 RepID=A0A1I1PG85_9GAMM|nr:sodium:proton antiporter [Pseudoalteromonas denitrificans]SFD08702.1 sodium/proton antiporter, CPA1 family [Pseudoalteromonas denitrificans DSM 6059]
MAAIYIAGIALFSVLAQWLAWVFKVPAILFLLLIGLLLGPIFSILNPDELLGDLLFPIISLSVAIILFEGSLTLHFRELKGIGKVVRNLCSIGMFTTFTIIALSCFWLLDIDWRVSAVLGAVLVVTGPTVITPLLNIMRPSLDVDRILRWEGIVIDPIGALFAVLVFETVKFAGPTNALSHTIFALFATLFIGLSLGALIGWLTTFLFRRDWIPYELQKFSVLAFVLFIFSLSNSLSHESGLLAVTVYGIWLANQDDLELDPILEFKEDLSMILISALFILLAARLKLSELLLLGPTVVIFLVIVLFVARPLCIAVSTLNSELTFKGKLLLAWISPRGIVAAAVGSVFSLSLAEQGIKDSEKIVPLIFTVIIVTVILQSLTALPLVKLLKMHRPEPSTILIIGANHVARAIAKGLEEQNIDIYLSDPAWENCKMARMNGLPCYYGNPQSEHAERYLPMTDIKTVLALSPNRHHNALGVQYFSHLIKDKNVFSLKSSNIHAKANKDSATFLSRQILFLTENEENNTSFTRLSNLIAKGGKVSTTRIAQEFTWCNYLEVNKEAIPLFIINSSGHVTPFTPKTCTPEEGEMVIAMQPAKITIPKETS